MNSRPSSPSSSSRTGATRGFDNRISPSCISVRRSIPAPRSTRTIRRGEATRTPSAGLHLRDLEPLWPPLNLADASPQRTLREITPVRAPPPSAHPFNPGRSPANECHRPLRLQQPTRYDEIATMNNRAVRQTQLIDRFTQGFARRSINQRTSSPTDTKYEGSQNERIRRPSIKNHEQTAADNQTSNTNPR